MIFTEELQIDLLKVFAKHHLVSENILRDNMIRLEYAAMKKEKRNLKECREHLADKYFISLKSIEAIVYKPKEPKEMNPALLNILIEDDIKKNSQLKR